MDEEHILPISKIVSAIADEILPDLESENGWANLADVGNRLSKLYTDFDARNYGYQKLSQLIKAQSCFEIDTPASEKHSTTSFIRKKQ